MNRLEIKNVDTRNLQELIDLCIPTDKRKTKSFIKGAKSKRNWAIKMLERYGEIAKIAYLDSKPVGMIQFMPHPMERLIEITCIYIPEQENLRKGIGRLLFNTLLNDMKNPKYYFENRPPNALIIWAFQVPGVYPQHKFFKKMGFKQVSEDNPFLLYYPLESGYEYKPESKEYIPQPEDRGKALIFYDPSCPFCLYFAEKIKESITEVAPNIPIRMVNQFEESEEVEKRGGVSNLIVNQRQIKSFFLDKENFQKEVKEALKK